MIGANDLVLTSDAILLICPYTYLLRYKMICDKLIRSNIVFIFKLKFTMISKTKIFLFFLQELYLLMHNNKKKRK